MLIRTASFPGSLPGQAMAPAAPRQSATARPRTIVRRPAGQTFPERLADQAALAREARAFMAEHHMGVSEFCDRIGQASNYHNGFFIKAEEGRLRATTVAKVRAFMAAYE